MGRFTGLLGLLVIVAAAYFFSAHRKAIQKRVVIWGLTLQFALAFLVLKTPLSGAFYQFSLAVNALLSYSSEGARFVFGDKLGLKTPYCGVSGAG